MSKSEDKPKKKKVSVQDRILDMLVSPIPKTQITTDKQLSYNAGYKDGLKAAMTAINED